MYIKEDKRRESIVLDKRNKLGWRGGEFHSTEEMAVDIKGMREEMKVKKGKRGDGEPMNAQIHLFSAFLYLVAHTFSPLQQPVFTAINLGVAFWPASPT